MEVENQQDMTVDTAGKPSPSRSRSASYSPLPPKSPPKQSPSPSPIDSRRGTSRSRSRSNSRSPSAGGTHPSIERRRSRDPLDAKSVQIRGLTKVVTESHLEHIFAFYGAIANIILPTFRVSGENKGKGWIVYRSNASAQKAQEHMDGGQVDGAVISVRQEHMPEEDQQRGYRGYNHGYPNNRRGGR